MPALDTWRLKRRRADSIPSFSPTVTWVMKRWSDLRACQCSNHALRPLTYGLEATGSDGGAEASTAAMGSAGAIAR